MSSEIYVCQAGSCLRKGSEAVLLEIEELANAVDQECHIQESGCLGLCNQAPNAAIVGQADEPEFFTSLTSLEKSTKVVVKATGKVPDTSNPELQARLRGVRQVRTRQHAESIYRWNEALRALVDHIKMLDEGGEKKELVSILQDLVEKAGFSARQDVLLSNLHNDNPVSPLSSFEMPDRISNYSLWILERVHRVSRHSAVFKFRSEDLKRGTPHPRGRGRNPPTPRTWHTTMLAEVTDPEEGPLPWIERDYTPISCALDWERGNCELLIKIYKDGAATSWLSKVATQHNGGQVRVWLSQPIPTLNVPTLLPLNSSSPYSFNPKSILLILGGTGVVALPQILHHRDPNYKIGIPVRRSQQLHVPTELILSCRADDVLMLPQIIQLCCEEKHVQQEGRRQIAQGLRHCTLLLTGENDASEEEAYPFPAFEENPSELLSEFEDLPNAEVLQQRLTPELVRENISRMPSPCRVVVSGPSGFNAAAREMLIHHVKEEVITVLEA